MISGLYDPNLLILVKDSVEPLVQDEIKVLSKIVKSNRIHFKEIEKADFATLQKQLEEYEKKVEVM